MDLVRERSNLTIDVNALRRCWLDINRWESYSIEEIDKLKEEMKQLGVYPSMEYYYYDREAKIDDDTRRVWILMEYFSKKISLSDRLNPLIFALNPAFFGLDRHALMLHLNGFIKTIELLGSDEQKEAYLKRSYSFDIIGCYAQTELGHGSDVQGLETTATYDQDTQEFIIDSPTVSSVKFWPGGLGKIANYAVVHAQTYVKDKHIGVQTFVVRLRDENHDPLDGIHLGDIGAKYAFASTDNGFVRFSKIRIPRENMLAKYTQVSYDGTVTLADPKTVRLGYGNMLFLRVLFFTFRSISLSRLATIAIRYSIVRKQFRNKETGEERQILDYQTQQFRLFPILGLAYTIALSSQTLIKKYLDYESELKSGGQPFSQLRQLHALWSALKPVATWKNRKYGEVVKQWWGGHGFLEVSGIHRIVKEEEGLVTAEGANNVILQQTGKYLLEQWQKLNNEEELDEITQFLKYHTTSSTTKHLPVSSDLKSLNERIISAFDRRVAVFLRIAAEKFQKLIASGMTIETVWNEKTQQQFINVATYFGEAYMIKEAFKNLDSAAMNEKTRPIIEKWMQIYGIFTILDELTSFLYTDFFEEKDIEELRQTLRELTSLIRKNAIGIVDSFGYTDDDLMSVLGSYDGDVYNRLIGIIRKNPLNKSNTLPGYFEYIKPLRSKI